MRDLQPVCVAGMHRSGTSICTRLIHLCRLYLGREDELVPATSDNQDGHWEHLALSRLNSSLLNELGGGWDLPPVLPEGWLAREGVVRLRARAERILDGFDGHEPWGWKDPRNSLVMPFWFSLRPRCRVVICLRNPIEVALSLRRRALMSCALGLTLWRIYNERLLDAVPPGQRIITHFERLLSEPREEARRLAGFLGLAPTEAMLDRCATEAKGSLRHHHFLTRHLLEMNVAPQIVKLYARLCEEAGWRESPAETALAKEMGDLSVGSGRGGGRHVDLSALEDELWRRQVRYLRNGLKSRDKKIAELTALLEARETEPQATAGEIVARDALASARTEDARVRTDSQLEPPGGRGGG